MVLLKSRRAHFLYENLTPPWKIRWPDLKRCPFNFQILENTHHFRNPKSTFPIFKGGGVELWGRENGLANTNVIVNFACKGFKGGGGLKYAKCCEVIYEFYLESCVSQCFLRSKVSQRHHERLVPQSYLEGWMKRIELV